MTSAFLMALLKELLSRYPELTVATLVAQLEVWGDEVLGALAEWWENATPEEPWPGLPPMDQVHGQGPPSDEPLMP